MASWKDSIRAGLLPGSAASLLSAIALIVAGQRRERLPAAPVNAISHWVWGEPALHEDGASVRHTALGYLIHHAASLFWATLHVRFWGAPKGADIAKAAATSATAAFVDYKLTPRRFTPGFEHRLTKPQLAAVYVLFAVGLAVGSAAVTRSRRPSRAPR